MPEILVTGATGFVGSRLVNQLIVDGRYQPIVVVRSNKIALLQNVKRRVIDNILPNTNWSSVVEDVDVIIHLAARVHVMNDTVSDPLAEFRRINTEATLNLAKQAAKAGVKRFIFLSSIKVNGEMTKAGHFFSANDDFIPTDPYGLSKYEAEQGLLNMVEETGMDVVIIRPPLIYGPGVKANFALMMKWIKKGLPLPLGAVNNKRSLVAVDNLVSFIIHCIEHPRAVNEIFLISDGEDVSTKQLVTKLAKALDKKSRLVPIPISWINFLAKKIGKREVVSRLVDSLQVDSLKVKKVLNWKPVISMDEQLKKLAKDDFE